MLIEQAVKKALGPKYLEDICETRIGWLSKSNSNYSIGPKYLISYNYCTPNDEWEYIKQFAGRSCFETLTKFYRATNGMRILSDHFVVPGVRFMQPEFKELDYFNIPVDLSLFAGSEYPRYSPIEGAVIGSSLRKQGDNTSKLMDIIDEGGEIISGFFNNTSEILERNDSFEAWIERRVLEAINEYEGLEQIAKYSSYNDNK